jgi:hypothetical protein
MGFLRSPASHGISRDFRTIHRAIEEPRDFTPPYHRPSVELFAQHLQRHGRDAIADVKYVQGEARVIRAAGSEPGYLVELATNSSEQTIATDKIILSVGQPVPHLPPVLRNLPSAAPVFHVHTDSGTLDALKPGSDVALVGGGIAAAHLAVSLSRSGQTVTLWNRDRFTSHQFDSDPCFVGPRCGSLFSSVADYGLRRTLIQRTRRPGSVPPELFRQLRTLERDRRIRVLRGELLEAAAAGSRVFLRGRGSVGGGPGNSRTAQVLAGEYDAVVACTGFAPGPPAAELIRRTADELQLRRAEDGYPLPSTDLQWAPGLFVTGALAELEIGPPARNLVGAHLAGRRIMPALRDSLTVPRYH